MYVRKMYLKDKNIYYTKLRTRVCPQQLLPQRVIKVLNHNVDT